jgi:PAS domain S-box-containing protein
MGPRWPRQETLKSEAGGCLLAVFLCLIGLAISRAVSTPIPIFLLVILLVSLPGYKMAGYVATVVAAGVYYWSFLEAPKAVAPHDGTYAQLQFLVLAGCIIPGLSRRYQSSRQFGPDTGLMLETILRDCPIAILLLDGASTLVCCNSAALALFRYEHSALQGQPVTKLLPHFTNSALVRDILLGLPGSGENLYVSAICSQVAGRTMVFLHDVTERSQIEDELKTSRESLKLQVETIPGLIYIRKADGRLEQINHRVVDFSNIPLATLLLDDGMTAVHPEDRTRVAELNQHHFQGALPFSYEFRHLREDGTYRWFLATTEPQKNINGEVVRWYSLLTDIDDRKMMEASLRSMQMSLAEASRMSTVAELTASVAHEISQPLSAIISNCQACIRYLSTMPISQDLLHAAVQRILRNGRDATQTVKNIRVLFRRRNLETEQVNLRHLIEEVLLLHETQIDELDISVNVAI